MLKVEQIKNTYYYKDFDPTLDNLNKVMKIIEKNAQSFVCAKNGIKQNLPP